MLGRLDKGGWIVIEQSDVGDHQWRIVHFQMVMNGRVFFRSKSFDSVEDETHFTAVPVELSYVQAIQALRSTKRKPGRSKNTNKTAPAFKGRPFHIPITASLR